MLHFVLGIDPGQKGALCLLSVDRKCCFFYPLPFVGPEFDVHEMLGLITELFDTVEARDGLLVKAYVEKAQAMPKNGAASMFKYGKAFGALEACLIARGIPIVEVSPSTWTKLIHEGMSKTLAAKEKSLLIAKRSYPHLEFKRNVRCRVDDEGFIDACLIAEYGVRNQMGYGQITKLS